LNGRVTDPDGRPVAGARIVVVGALGAVADRETSADGSFEIDALPAGVYGIHVVKDGFTADPFRADVAAFDARTLDFALRVSALAESIVVSASQIEMPLSRAADAMTAITAADLEARQIETVADALRFVPGLAVARSGGRGAITSLFPRGGASNYTLVLVDGIRANAFGGGYDFSHLSTADVDRIEIVRGPESALFGSDAIGAVVHVVTKRGGPPHAEGLVEGGSSASGSTSRGHRTCGSASRQTTPTCPVISRAPSARLRAARAAPTAASRRTSRSLAPSAARPASSSCARKVRARSSRAR